MSNIIYQGSWYTRTYYILVNKTSSKKYIGQHINFNAVGKTYLGSGTHWIAHCKKHGGYTTKNILVEYKKEFLCKTSADIFLLLFERKHPNYYISENNEWSNQVPENTYNNPRPSVNPEISRKMGNTRKKKIKSGEIVPNKWYRNETNDIYCLEKDKPYGWREGRMPTSGSKGLKWYNNGKEQGTFEENKQPSFWKRGMLPKSNSNYKRYTDGNNTELFMPGLEPHGWMPGVHWNLSHIPKTNTTSVYDTIENKVVRIPTDVFHSNKDRYISCSSKKYRNIIKNA